MPNPRSFFAKSADRLRVAASGMVSKIARIGLPRLKRFVRSADLRHFIGLGGMRVANIVLSLTLITVLARFYPLTEVGRYFLFVAVSLTVSAILLQPIQVIGLRFWSIWDAGDMATRRHFFNCGIGMVAAAYPVLGAAGLAIADAGIGPSNAFLAVITSPLFAVSVSLSGANVFLAGLLRAEGWVATSQVPDMLFKPGLVLVLIAIAGLAHRWGGVSVDLLTLYVLGQAISLAFLFALLRGWRLLAHIRLADLLPRGAWIKEYSHVVLYNAAATLTNQIDLLYVGISLPVSMVAIYKIASQATSLIVSGIGFSNLIFSPLAAVAFDRGDKVALQHVARRSGQMSFALAVVLAVLLVFSRPFLIDILGAPFAAAYVPLMILAFASLIDAYYGSTTILATMTGNSLPAFRAQMASIAAACVLLPTLSHFWGLIGIAIASAASIAIWNILLGAMLYRRLGIRTGAF